MLKIKDLHASIDDKDILRGINLEINAGEVHAIMGPKWFWQKYISFSHFGSRRL